VQRAAPPPPPPPAATGPGAGAGGQEGAGQAAAARHDRRKALLIPGDVPDPFLQKIGLQTSDGRVRAGMQARSGIARAARVGAGRIDSGSLVRFVPCQGKRLDWASNIQTVGTT
jgi:hypothetical protein